MKTLRGLIPPLVALLMVAGLWSILQVNVGQAAPSGIIVNTYQTTIPDFNQGSFYLTGMTRNGDGEVTLLRVGIAGDWITTTNSTGFVPRMEHAAIDYDNRLYVFGGRVGFPTSLRSIQFTNVNTTTHNVSNWITATTSLATSIYTYTSGGGGVAGLSAVQLNGRVYLLGGHDGSHAILYNTVSFATIDPATGQLGALATTAPLPQGLANGQAVVLNDRIYYLGGVFNSIYGATNTVYYASPDPATGVITTWLTATAPLPYSTFGQMAVATVNNRIYSMAGISNTIGNGSTPDVYYAQPLTASGDITGWLRAQTLPQSIFDGAAVTFGGQIYDTGGALGGGIIDPSDYVVAGLDVLDTGITGWVTTNGITPPRLLHTAVVNSDGWLYIIGGSSGPSTIDQNIINAAATTGESGSSYYAPNGNFLSTPFDLGRNYILHQINWNTTLPDPSTVTATLRYRYALAGGAYTSWSDQYPSNNVSGMSTTTLPITATARYLQYQVFFTTTDPLATPVLNQVGVQYEVPTPPTFQKSANPPSGSNVSTGDRITYTLTYSNVNDNALTNVVIRDTAPVSTTYVAGSIFGSPGVTTNDLNAPDLSWTIATLPAHTGGTIGFAVTVNNDAPEGGVIYNIASFDSDQVAAVQSSRVNHKIGIPPTLVKSHISSAPPQAFGRVQPGDLITYTLAYSNPSLTQSSTNTIITDVLPIGVTYLGYSGTIAPSVNLINGHQVLQWAVGTIPAQAQGAVGFYAQVVTNATIVPNGGSIANTAFGTASQQPFSSNTDSVPVRYRFDLTLSINDGVTYAAEGSVLTYTIWITNVTSVPITPTGIVISDFLKPGLPTNQPGVLRCVSPCAGWAFAGISGDGSQVYSRTIPFLGPNQTSVLTLVAQVSPTLLTDAPGVREVANQVSAIDDGQQGIEVNLINQTAVDNDMVELPFVLVKSHISSAPPQAFGRVQPGDLITYTLAYSNPSLTQSSTNTIITDVLPIGVTYLGYSGTIAPSVNLINGRQVLQWSVGTIPAQTGGTVGFYVQVQTNPAFVPDGASINNTAQIGTAGQQPFSSNTDNVPVRYRFDILLSIDDGVTKAPPGSLLTYSIRITNVTSLPITPTNIAIYDYLEPGRPTSQPGVLKCAAPCTGWAFAGISGNGSQMYSRTIPFLGPNQSAVVTMVAQISPTLWTDAPDVLVVASQAYAIDDGQHGAEINPINQIAEDADTVSGPDISVTDLHAASKVVVPGKPAQFVTTLFNNGFITTGSSDGSGWFGVDLYVRPVGAPRPASPADRYLGYCLDASNYPCVTQINHYQSVGYPNGGLAAGATYALTYTLSITPAGTYWLYVQADLYWAGNMSPYTSGTPNHGRIVEGNETNNIFGPIVVKVDYVKVYLPLMRKK